MVTSRKYSTHKDYDNVYKFLSDIFDETKNLYAWDVGRWTFNRFCVHSDEELLRQRNWDQSVRLWEEDEQIIAVANIEEPGDYFYHIKPGYESILNEMVEWSFKKALDLNSDKSSIQVTAFHLDLERIRLYNQLGATKQAFIDDHRPYGLKILRLNVKLLIDLQSRRLIVMIRR